MRSPVEIGQWQQCMDQWMSDGIVQRQKQQRYEGDLP